VRLSGAVSISGLSIWILGAAGASFLYISKDLKVLSSGNIICIVRISVSALKIFPAHSKSPLEGVVVFELVPYFPVFPVGDRYSYIVGPHPPFSCKEFLEDLFKRLFSLNEVIKGVIHHF